MLRQAPNIIMVGEIRDRETAEIALHAALTGHLVFSTLHTNDAVGAVARLANLGVAPFLLSSALRGVLAQRLVRRVCPDCRQPHEPAADERAALGMTPSPSGSPGFMKGAGCPACGGTGYRGRLGIFELLVLGEEFSQLLHEPGAPGALRARARVCGMRSLREDGARKASAGLTTIEEVVSITADDPR
jgi:general secretion pathway protein E/type IV pilus assembly protein PilB